MPFLELSDRPETTGRARISQHLAQVPLLPPLGDGASSVGNHAPDHIVSSHLSQQSSRSDDEVHPNDAYGLAAPKQRARTDEHIRYEQRCKMSGREKRNRSVDGCCLMIRPNHGKRLCFSAFRAEICLYKGWRALAGRPTSTRHETRAARDAGSLRLARRAHRGCWRPIAAPPRNEAAIRHAAEPSYGVSHHQVNHGPELS